MAFHLAIIGLVVVMINLAIWQIHRQQERNQFNDTVRSRQEVPVRDLRVVLEGSSNPKDLDWYLARVSGVFESEDELLVVNRSQDGTAGVDALTPLRLNDSSIVLINRGFVPLGTDMPKAPSGTVELIGRVRPSEKHHTGATDNASTGDLKEIQRIDIERIAKQLDGAVLPIYLEQLQSKPSSGDLPAPVAKPVLSSGPHISYAVQWFLFSVCALVGWWLAVKKSIKTRLKAASGA